MAMTTNGVYGIWSGNTESPEREKRYDSERFV